MKAARQDPFAGARARLAFQRGEESEQGRIGALLEHEDREFVRAFLFSLCKEGK